MRRTHLVVIALLALVGKTYAIEHKDSNLLPIGAKELRELIQHTPADSAQHQTLISRAYVSGFAKEAYEEYAQLWKKQPNDAYANFLLGMAAERYMQYLTSPFANVKDRQKHFKEVNNLQEIARLHLSKTIRLQPKLAMANTVYGFFLWQYDNRMSEGLALVKKGVELDPKRSGGHSILGMMYANSSGNAYNPKRAEKELSTAILLNPLNSSPHEQLAWLYVNLRRYKEAQKEVQIYLSLVPESIAQSPGIKILKQAIDRGLNR